MPNGGVFQDFAQNSRGTVTGASEKVINGARVVEFSGSSSSYATLPPNPDYVGWSPGDPSGFTCLAFGKLNSIQSYSHVIGDQEAATDGWEIRLGHDPNDTKISVTFSRAGPYRTYRAGSSNLISAGDSFCVAFTRDSYEIENDTRMMYATNGGTPTFVDGTLDGSNGSGLPGTGQAITNPVYIGKRVDNATDLDGSVECVIIIKGFVEDSILQDLYYDRYQLVEPADQSPIAIGSPAAAATSQYWLPAESDVARALRGWPAPGKQPTSPARVDYTKTNLEPLVITNIAGHPIDLVHNAPTPRDVVVNWKADGIGRYANFDSGNDEQLTFATNKSLASGEWLSGSTIFRRNSVTSSAVIFYTILSGTYDLIVYVSQSKLYLFAPGGSNFWGNTAARVKIGDGAWHNISWKIKIGGSSSDHKIWIDGTEYSDDASSSGTPSSLTIDDTVLVSDTRYTGNEDDVDIRDLMLFRGEMSDAEMWAYKDDFYRLYQPANPSPLAIGKAEVGPPVTTKQFFIPAGSPTAKTARGQLLAPEKQPQFPVKLEAKKFIYASSNWQSKNNIADGVAPTSDSDNTVESDQYGRHLYFDGTSGQELVYPKNLALPSGTHICVGCRFKAEVSTETHMVVWGQASNDLMALYYSNTRLQIVVDVAYNCFGSNPARQKVIDGEWHNIIVDVEMGGGAGTNTRCFIDGVEYPDELSVAAPSSKTIDSVRIGSLEGFPGYGGGRYAGAYIFLQDYAVPDAELRDRSLDFYRYLKPANQLPVSLGTAEVGPTPVPTLSNAAGINPTTNSVTPQVDVVFP